jgi:hypothetical protein
MAWFSSKSNKKKGAVETPPPRSVTPAPEIPTLKEKKKEKKGAGVPWYAGSGAGGPGAMVGGGIARVGGGMSSGWGFLGSQKIAMTLANVFGKSTMLGGMFAGKMGGSLVLAGMLGWGGLLGLAGMKLGGVGLQPVQRSGGVSLSGAGRSGIVIDAPKDRSLDYLAHANQGEIVWDKEHPMAPKDAPNEEEEIEGPDDAAAEEQPAFEMPDVAGLMGGASEDEKKKLKDGFAKGLTSDMSQLRGGSGGFANGKLTSKNFNLKKSIGNTPKFSQKGKLKKFKRKMSPARGKGMKTLRGKSDRAMGQLKLARHMSRTAVGAADQGARAFSADAFDQGKTIGGELQGIEGEGIVVPPGNGAPDGLASGAPDVGPGMNATPYQGAVDAAKSQTDSAQNMKTTSLALIAAGTALLLAAAKASFPVNIILAAIGGALMAAGAMMAMMAGKMGDNAKKQGDHVEDTFGQKDQGQVIDTCADQASQNNVKSDNCSAGNPSKNRESNPTVRQAVEEESNANYTLTD